MPLHFRFGPIVTHRTFGLALLLGMGCLCLSIGCLGSGGTTNQNGTQSHEGSVTIPPDTIVEVVYPGPFATPPTLTIYAFHSDWEVKEQTEKSFRIRSNKNLSTSAGETGGVEGARRARHDAAADDPIQDHSHHARHDAGSTEGTAGADKFSSNSTGAAGATGNSNRRGRALITCTRHAAVTTRA